MYHWLASHLTVVVSLSFILCIKKKCVCLIKRYVFILRTSKTQMTESAETGDSN